uniref:Uncharacterized protein n=1 Tax=Onchocerca volvulus TaxID=6282 RepID=A0A8R1XYZ2_ONCVO
MPTTNVYVCDVYKTLLQLIIHLLRAPPVILESRNRQQHQHQTIRQIPLSTIAPAFEYFKTGDEFLAKFLDIDSDHDHDNNDNNAQVKKIWNHYVESYSTISGNCFFSLPKIPTLKTTSKQCRDTNRYKSHRCFTDDISRLSSLGLTDQLMPNHQNISRYYIAKHYQWKSSEGERREFNPFLIMLPLISQNDFIATHASSLMSCDEPYEW